MEDHELLRRLREEDERCSFLKRRLKEIPAALAGMREEGLTRESGAEARLEELQEIETSIRRLEGELQTKRAALAREQAKEGRIETEREERALAAAVQTLDRAIEGLEEKVLAKLESQEILERERRLREAGDRELAGDLRREAEELEREQEECSQELERAQIQRERLLAEADDVLERRYRRLFKSMGHGCIAALVDGACGGCGERLPPQQEIEVRSRNAIISCQGCGRLVLAVES